MKVCIRQFLSLNHSWSIVGQNIARSLISLGHQVDLFSTNGINHFPPDLLPNLIGYGEENKIISGKIPDNSYDACFSYTCMKNFGGYLRHSPRNRFGIWAFEFAGKNALPIGFAKAHQYCDNLLAPTSFARQVFLDSGVPEGKVIVVPHGINIQEINTAAPYLLKTKKSIKILINLGQLHKRKNISGALEMFGKAFNKKSDVCLVLKIQDKKPTQQFELSFRDMYQKFLDKFPDHAEVEVIRNFIPNIYSLYKACDITFSPSHCEGFGLVPFEGLACGLVPVASNYGGFTDFLDKDNALLINGKEFNVPPDHLYYQSKVGTKAFMPDVDHGVDRLQQAVLNINALSYVAKLNAPFFCEKNSWDVVANQILNLVE